MFIQPAFNLCFFSVGAKTQTHEHGSLQWEVLGRMGGQAHDKLLKHKCRSIRVQKDNDVLEETKEDSQKRKPSVITKKGERRKKILYVIQIENKHPRLEFFLGEQGTKRTQPTLKSERVSKMMYLQPTIMSGFCPQLHSNLALAPGFGQLQYLPLISVSPSVK